MKNVFPVSKLTVFMVLWRFYMQFDLEGHVLFMMHESEACYHEV